MKPKENSYEDDMRNLDAIHQLCDRAEAAQAAIMKLDIPLSHKEQRIAKVARDCLKGIRRINPGYFD